MGLGGILTVSVGGVRDRTGQQDVYGSYCVLQMDNHQSSTNPQREAPQAQELRFDVKKFASTAQVILWTYNAGAIPSLPSAHCPYLRRVIS